MFEDVPFNFNVVLYTYLLLLQEHGLRLRLWVRTNVIFFLTILYLYKKMDI